MLPRTAAVLPFLLLVALAGSSPAAPDAAGRAGLPGFREVPVATLPCGERAGLSQDAGRETCGNDSCDLLVFPGSADDIYVLDRSTNLLKHLDPKGPAPSFTAVAGPTLGLGDRLPHAGTPGSSPSWSRRRAGCSLRRSDGAFRPRSPSKASAGRIA